MCAFQNALSELPLAAMATPHGLMGELVAAVMPPLSLWPIPVIVTPFRALQ